MSQLSQLIWCVVEVMLLAVNLSLHIFFCCRQFLEYKYLTGLTMQVVTCLHPSHSAVSTKSWALKTNFRPAPIQQNFISVLVLTYFPLMRQINFCWLCPGWEEQVSAGVLHSTAPQPRLRQGDSAWASGSQLQLSPCARLVFPSLSYQEDWLV